MAKFAVTIMTAAVAAVLPFGVYARLNVPTDKFVRSANYYLKAGIGIPSSDYAALAKYDLLIFPAEAQVYNRDMFTRLRELNPNVTILAYVPTKSYVMAWADSLHARLSAGLDSSMWLLSSSGGEVSVWPGTKMLNMVSGWGKYLPEHVEKEIWSTGLWDGIFYDEFSATVSWVNGGDIDIHRDGTKDDAALADVVWERATVNMLRDTRMRLGPTAVIITNGDSASSLQPFVNGRMFETFPTPWEGRGRWEDSMSSYLRLHDEVGYTPVFVINGNTGNTGARDDYRKVRYAVTSALMGDGFFGFDYGDQDHGQLWWYDEQDARLGAPLGPAVNLTLPQGRGVSAGVWRRDFRDGVAIVNSSSRAQTVDFETDFERLNGRQDSAVNNGQPTNSVTIAPNDGIILLKPLTPTESIVGSAFPNGSYARVFAADGSKKRNGFFAYVPPFGGSARIAVEDLDGDGVRERVVGDDTSVTVYGGDGVKRVSFAPYGDGYRLGVNFAVGDLDGDGRKEIVTGTGAGAEPRVRLYNIEGVSVGGAGFLAFDAKFRGGVRVAMGDVYGTGRDMIVVGAGPGGGPHVRVMDRWGGIRMQFFAYDQRFRGGVEVSVGDLDGDGREEIVTGAGPGGGPHVRVFNRFGRAVGGFFAGDKAARNGVRVAVTDADGDGVSEIAALTTDVFRVTGR